MQKITTAIVVIVCCLCSSSKSFAQASISSDTIKQMLINDWVRAKAYTGDYMKAMPDNKYSFKAQDSVRSFAQQLLHIADANMFFLAMATGTQPDFGGGELDKRASAQSADSVRYHVNKAYDFAIASLRRMNAADFVKTSTFTMDKPYTFSRLAWFMKAFEHQTHHRGQTTIYLRLAGVKPPDERLF